MKKTIQRDGANLEFLPLEVDGDKVYAGFGSRLFAALIDIAVFILLYFVFHPFESLSIYWALFIAFISSTLFSAYSVYFHYKYGATFGKMAANIKVTLPNGTELGLKEALLRSSVDIGLAIFLLIAQVWAMLSVDPDEYLNAGFLKRFELLLPLYPAWYLIIERISDLWYWGELIVLLFNKRKRALHDFIAGTVVIHKKFAVPSVKQESPHEVPIH